ncbi:hypothetical protein CEQ90_17535 [Lewinellaceae bacterium SD302]|nr:hypothetical protein CEQ90_20580 [Lewinellaceae bacterium SD302]PHI18552.1 hypothetical protein CEQ90_17535 [Lewinellaceae bacterium SD302]
MAISYREIRTDRQWKAATGYSEKNFHQLVKLFSSAYEEFHETTLEEQLTQRDDDPKFTSYEDMLFFVLYSLKSGLTYDLIALNFNMSRSVAFEQQAAHIVILQMALDRKGLLPKRYFESLEELQKHFQGHDELIIDGTEQKRQRPGNQEDQKEDYSGKKKRIP